ncbi:cation diffusion facilitator family transporter [Thermococcus sp.]
MRSLKVKMLASIVLNLIITGAEVLGGILSGSLSLLSDSLHNLSDALSLLASYFAIKIGERRANEKYTFGYKRAEILVAFMNSTVLIGVSLFLLVEAYGRFKSPQSIDTAIMLPVASLGLIANLLSVFLLHEHAHGLNVRSAYLHLLSDTLSSVAVVIGGLLIRLYGVSWVDPLVTVLISIYILREAYEVLRQSVDVLMEASPELDLRAIKAELESIPGVKNAHHFHAWRIGEEEVHFECHLSVEDMSLSEAQRIIDEAEKRLRKFGITHVTVQLEVNRCEPGLLCSGRGQA